MTATTQKLATAVIAAVAALALGTPLANAAPHRHSTTTTLATPFVSPPPTLHRRMQWFRWHPTARSLQGRAAQFGSTAVIGLESMDDLASLRERYRFDRVRAIPELHAAEVSVDPAKIRALLADAPTDSRIRYVAPTGSARRLLSMPNDPLLRTIDPTLGLPSEWQFSVSHMERALELSPGSPSILVGTIDTGVADVPDLAGKVDQRWTVSRRGRLTRDTRATVVVGHGTAVASLIAANVGDGFGMAGFGGASHLITIHEWAFTDVSTAAALMKLDSLGVRIVNMSFGGDALETPIMLDAIHKAAADGMLLVAAAGNSSHAVAHPAADLQPAGGVQSYGLAVGASDAHGNLAFFSNAGANLSLVAPGGYDGPCTGVLVAIAPLGNGFDDSCYPSWASTGGAQYAYVSGTSFSAPEVAGVAALIWAARPELKNYQVADIIKQSARRDADGWTPTMGCGVLDAGAALELATSRPTDRVEGGGSADAACSAAGDGSPAWPTPVRQPSVFALAASGKWGATAHLQFRVDQKSGEFAPTIVVEKNGTGVALLTRDFFRVESGKVYSLAWRTPKVKTKDVYRFFVTLSDRAGNKSAPSCGHISLR